MPGFRGKSVILVLVSLLSCWVLCQDRPRPSSLEILLRHLALADESGCLQRLVCYAGANVSNLGPAGARMNDYFGENSTESEIEWRWPVNRSDIQHQPDGYFLLASGPGVMRFKTNEGNVSRMVGIRFSQERNDSVVRRKRTTPVLESEPEKKTQDVNRTQGDYLEIFTFLSRPFRLDRASFFHLFRRGRVVAPPVGNMGLQVENRPDISHEHHSYADDDNEIDRSPGSDWYEAKPASEEEESPYMFEDWVEEDHLEERASNTSQDLQAELNGPPARIVFRLKRSEPQVEEGNSTDAVQWLNLEENPNDSNLESRQDQEMKIYAENVHITVQDGNHGQRRPGFVERDPTHSGLETFRYSFLLGLREGYQACLKVYPYCRESMMDVIAFVLSLFPFRSFT